MSTPLISVIVALTQGPATISPTGAAYAGTSVIVTDSSGTAQPAVTLNGKETPPFSFQTSVAPGNGTVVAQDLDVNGAAMGSPVSQTFTEVGTPVTFTPTSGITVTPV